MYENNYPNDRNYQNTGYQDRSTYGQSSQQDSYSGSSTYQGSTGSYQYSGTYPNGYAQVEQKRVKKPKEKKGTGSYFKKVAAAVSLGLFFGLFAGLGLFLVESASGMLDKNAETTAGTLQEAEDEATEATLSQIEKEAVSLIQQSETVTAVVSDVTGVVEEVMPSISRSSIPVSNPSSSGALWQA